MKSMVTKTLISLCCVFSVIFLAKSVSAQEVVTPYRTTPSSTPITSPKCSEFTFDASNSYDPDKENLSFFWDFGDGATGTDSIMVHKYDKSGDYKVVLTITDNSGLQCSTAVTSQVVRANKPPSSVFTVASEACVDQQLSLDGSGSYAEGSKRLNFEWDLGDGTRVTGQSKLVKSYSSGGQYKVTLKVDDGSNTFCSAETSEKIIKINEPPVAEISEESILKCAVDMTDLEVKFDASKSRDTNNDELTYYWDFGDGTKGEGVRVTHRYAQIGNYDVKLVAKDTSNLGCSTSIDFATVRLNEAPKANAGPDTTACTGQDVEFDGTNSYISKKGTALYQWNFGDGQSATGAKVVHTYPQAGKYTANLTIEDKLNPSCQPSTASKTVTVNTTPTVNLKANQDVCLGDEVFFEATSGGSDSGSIEYYWSFGDGSVLRAGSKVSHTYKQGGKYRVTVIADDGKKTACSTATAASMVKVNSAPVADAGPNLSCCIDVAADFNASGSHDPDGDNLNYTWDFGDGTRGKGVITSHSYNKGGTYNVTLTVDDGSNTACGKATTGFVANVNTGPVPIMNVR